MQPYFFPYPGYFGLMRDVDVFVFFDDVQYIDRGWVNRNRILGRDSACWWTMPVHAAPRHLSIASRRYLVRDSRERLLNRLAAAYRTAPHVTAVLSLVDRTLGHEDVSVAELNIRTLVEVALLLGIAPRYVRSSSLSHQSERGGQARIMDICRELGADSYLNPRGGTALYERAAFEAAGMRLEFQNFEPIRYRQGTGASIENLSILDALMFNGTEETSSLLAANAGRVLSNQEARR
ncbi:WbqC family protein [Luteimonas fraxinea]|uniref:WbqC family protein n=1 Tax=Luteimonas fraxinea TaxID=2901869 RepID=UPI001E38CBD8|nr:WbqC family protein [Luteimonas fraxinea]MCD9124380.1 WbqC family protein [Luteimonas fraxinea]